MKRFTKGFKIAKLRLETPSRPDWELPSILTEKEAIDILAKPFRFLNKGAQCYAFVSEDNQYVLKIFRFDQRQLVRKKRSKRQISPFFEGCRLASTVAQEETGILYLHLNQTEGKYPILKASRPLGNSLRLPLDKYRFALQKRATPLLDGLFAAREVGKLPERIEMIVSLLEKRIGKRIGNTDPSLWRNFGFLEDVAIEFDFGNYVSRSDFSEKPKARDELERYVRHLRLWLVKNAPEYLPELEARIEEDHWL